MDIGVHLTVGGRFAGNGTIRARDVICGMVLDQTGAVVPEVAVVLTDEAGVPQATTRTDAAGTASSALLFTFWVGLATAVPGHVETFA